MHFEMCTSNACYCIINNNFAFNHAYTRDGEKSANSLYLIWSGRADLPSGMKNNDTGRINFCCIALVNFHFSSCLSHRHKHTHPSIPTLDTTNNNDKPDTRVRRSGVSDSALRLLLSLYSTRSIGPWNQLHHRHHHHCNAVNS